MPHGITKWHNRKHFGWELEYIRHHAKRTLNLCSRLGSGSRILSHPSSSITPRNYVEGGRRRREGRSDSSGDANGYCQG